MSFTVDTSKWSMYRLEQAEYSAGKPYEIEYGYDLFDLPSNQWNMEKIQEPSVLPVYQKQSNGYIRLEIGTYDIEEALLEEEESPYIHKQRNKNHLTAIAKKRKEDEEDFAHIFDKKDSIFSEFKTEKDERATEPPSILVIE